MPLDFRWVDRIHTRLLVRYGARWVAMNAPVTSVDGGEALLKADWAMELDGVSDVAIKHALAHLPAGDFPPNVGQFRALCINAPHYAAPQIAGPKADPKRVAEAMARMQAARAARRPLQWAYDLQAREKAGHKLSPGAALAWRDALATGIDTTITGDFTPVPQETLPPGMRNEVAA